MVTRDEFEYGRTALVDFGDGYMGIGIALFDKSDKYIGKLIIPEPKMLLEDYVRNLVEKPTVYDSERDGIKLLTDGVSTDRLNKWKEMFPIYYSDVKCKCGGKIKRMISIEEGHYYEPCDKCGYQKAKPPRKKQRHMCCPACNTALIPGKLKCYETLSEHCSDPNAERNYFRETWECPNKKCLVHKSGGFYGFEGSFYGGNGGIDSMWKHSEYWHARFSESEAVEKSVKKMRKDK